MQSYYRKAATVVEAVQLTLENLNEAAEILGKNDPRNVNYSFYLMNNGLKHPRVAIKLAFRNKNEILEEGDWIVRDSEGELSFYTSESFLRQYVATPQ
jgi:hypothetical protein